MGYADLVRRGSRRALLRASPAPAARSTPTSPGAAAPAPPPTRRRRHIYARDIATAEPPNRCDTDHRQSPLTLTEFSARPCQYRRRHQRGKEQVRTATIQRPWATADFSSPARCSFALQTLEAHASPASPRLSRRFAALNRQAPQQRRGSRPLWTHHPAPPLFAPVLEPTRRHGSLHRPTSEAVPVGCQTETAATPSPRWPPPLTCRRCVRRSRLGPGLVVELP